MLLNGQIFFPIRSDPIVYYVLNVFIYCILYIGYLLIFVLFCFILRFLLNYFYEIEIKKCVL